MSELRIHIHEPGSSRIERAIELTRAAASLRDREQVLAELCRTTAHLMDADIVSVYVVEPGPRGATALVMRANSGFAPEAIGTRLAAGEGITGLVVERQRPVSVDAAPRHHRFKHVPGLGEERFPAYLGVPLWDSAGVSGVLVVQRRERAPFGETDVALAAAVGAAFSQALQRSPLAAVATAPRTVSAARLRGEPLCAGAAVGRAIVISPLGELDVPAGRPRPPEEELRAGIDWYARILTGCRERLRGAVPLPRAIEEHLEQLDGCLGRLSSVIETGPPRPDAPAPRLEGLLRRGATGVIARAPGLASELEDLATLIYLGARRPRGLRVGGIAIAGRLTGALAVAAIARGCAAVVVDGGEIAPAARLLVHAAQLPALTGVSGLASLARTGDLLAIDAQRGTVRVNPG